MTEKFTPYAPRSPERLEGSILTFEDELKVLLTLYKSDFREWVSYEQCARLFGYAPANVAGILSHFDSLAKSHGL